MNHLVESHRHESRYRVSQAEFLKQLPGDLSLISSTDTEEEQSCVVEGSKTQITVRFTMHGYELVGPAASHTGFKSVMPGGAPDEGAIYGAIRKQIDGFNQFPYLVGPRDAPEMGWQSIRTVRDETRVQIRLCDWAYTGTLKALQSLGFECECKLNGYWLAPSTWDKEMVGEVLEPWLKRGSRGLPEVTLVHQMELAYAYSSCRNEDEQYSLF